MPDVLGAHTWCARTGLFRGVRREAFERFRALRWHGRLVISKEAQWMWGGEQTAEGQGKNRRTGQEVMVNWTSIVAMGVERRGWILGIF